MLHQTRQQWKWAGEADSTYTAITSTASRAYSVNVLDAETRSIVVRVQSRAAQSSTFLRK